MIFQEAQGNISINQFACPLAVFQKCEPEYISSMAWNRIWTDQVQCLTNKYTQQSDPFYTPDRFARYCNRLPVYQRALIAVNYTASTDGVIDAEEFTTLYLEEDLFT